MNEEIPKKGGKERKYYLDLIYVRRINLRIIIMIIFFTRNFVLAAV